MDAPEALEVLESMPHAVPVQPVPDKAHVTPLFWLSFATVGVKFCCWPVFIDAVVGETLTEMTDPPAGGSGLGAEPPPPHPERNASADTPAKTRTDRKRCGKPVVTAKFSSYKPCKGPFVVKAFPRTGQIRIAK
jgi:hypothetical protein